MRKAVRATIRAKARDAAKLRRKPVTSSLGVNSNGTSFSASAALPLSAPAKAFGFAVGALTCASRGKRRLGIE